MVWLIVAETAQAAELSATAEGGGGRLSGEGEQSFWLQSYNRGLE